MPEKSISPHNLSTCAKNSGFTLVELAIVLVVIGLIVGGILVGQDLIKAADIRASISQITNYNTAVSTFRTRFNALPGDAKNMSAIFTNNPNLRDGNASRSLDMCAGSPTALCDEYITMEKALADEGRRDLSGELLQFWLHLGQAELIGGNYSGRSFNGGLPEDGKPGYAYPHTKLGRHGVGVYTEGGQHFFFYGVDAIRGDYDLFPEATPAEAYAIDSKMDDGRPNAGNIVIKRVSRTALPAWVNQNVQGADYDFAGGEATACIQEALADLSSPRDATYALHNQNVVCGLRFGMN